MMQCVMDIEHLYTCTCVSRSLVKNIVIVEMYIYTITTMTVRVAAKGG